MGPNPLTIAEVYLPCSEKDKNAAVGVQHHGHVALRLQNGERQEAVGQEKLKMKKVLFNGHTINIKTKPKPSHTGTERQIQSVE